MQSSYLRFCNRRVSHVLTLVGALLVFVPVFAAAVECGEERFVSGDHTLPSHDEAMAKCREQAAAMTDPVTGTYTATHACHDEGDPGQRGPWRYGRVAVDVVTRDGGDSYTFEGLWMCKPVEEEAFWANGVR